jgi:hypothetical protein
MKPYIYLFLLSSSILWNLTAHAQFAPGDITGLWQCTKPGNDIIIEIMGENGVIRSTGTTNLSKKLLGGFMYMNIKFDQVEKKLWVAQKNVWKTKADDPELPASGRWVKAEMLTFKMSADKNTMTAYGDLPFKRISKLINTSKEPDGKMGSKDCFKEDFGGVIGCFIVTDQGIIGRFNYPNVTDEDHALLMIKTEDHQFLKYDLASAGDYTASFKGKSIEIQVIYHKAEGPEEKSRIDKMIDFIKGKVRTQVTKDYLKIKTKKDDYKGTSFGVRG